LAEDAGLAGIIDQQIRRGGIDVLANLELHTTVGREATYLVGGRQAIPLIEDSTVVNVAATPDLADPLLAASSLVSGERPTRQLELGMRLGFLAVPLADGSLRMRAKTQTRSLDFGQATARDGVLEQFHISYRQLLRFFCFGETKRCRKHIQMTCAAN